jgi:hypothetical protein
MTSSALPPGRSSFITNGRPDWMRDGVCRQYAGQVSWFPDLGQSTAMAKAVCARCPVRPDCVE